MTRVVIVLTAVMMVGEIIAGVVFGSMALLADGLHMASHTVALGITAFAYAYTRRHAHDPRFCFGTGQGERARRVRRARCCSRSSPRSWRSRASAASWSR